MTILSIKPVFAGRVIQVNIERVRLPNASVADLEIIEHQLAVATEPRRGIGIAWVASSCSSPTSGCAVGSRG